LIPEFTVDGKQSGETLMLTAGNTRSGSGNTIKAASGTGGTKQSNTGRQKNAAQQAVKLKLDWTFPLEYIDIISGDGERVYHEKISMRDTKSFGSREFSLPVNLAGRKWVRVEVWDIASNGAFTQSVWIE
jgi:hypothetical protein